MSLATESTPSPPARSQLIALIEKLPPDKLSPALTLLEDLLQLPTEAQLYERITTDSSENSGVISAVRTLLGDINPSSKS